MPKTQLPMAVTKFAVVKGSFPTKSGGQRPVVCNVFKSTRKLWLQGNPPKAILRAPQSVRVLKPRDPSLRRRRMPHPGCQGTSSRELCWPGACCFDLPPEKNMVARGLLYIPSLSPLEVKNTHAHTYSIYIYIYLFIHIYMHENTLEVDS